MSHHHHPKHLTYGIVRLDIIEKNKSMTKHKIYSTIVQIHANSSKLKKTLMTSFLHARLSCYLPFGEYTLTAIELKIQIFTLGNVKCHAEIVTWPNMGQETNILCYYNCIKKSRGNWYFYNLYFFINLIYIINIIRHKNCQIIIYITWKRLFFLSYSIKSVLQ